MCSRAVVDVVGLGKIRLSVNTCLGSSGCIHYCRVPLDNLAEARFLLNNISATTIHLEAADTAEYVVRFGVSS